MLHSGDSHKVTDINRCTIKAELWLLAFLIVAILIAAAACLYSEQTCHATIEDEAQTIEGRR